MNKTNRTETVNARFTALQAMIRAGKRVKALKDEAVLAQLQFDKARRQWRAACAANPYVANGA